MQLLDKVAGPDVSGVTRTRALVTVFFMLDGFLFANWVVRVPDVKAHVAASPGGLGLALLGVSGGAVVTMGATGRLCARFGSRPITVATSVLMSLAVMLPAQVSSVGALGAVLLVFGAGYGGLNVAINSEAVDVIHRLDRPVMPTFHAAYSFGGLLGSVIGGAVASVLAAGPHLTIVGVAGLLVTACAGTLLLRGDHPPTPTPADAPGSDSSVSNEPASGGPAPGGPMSGDPMSGDRVPHGPVPHGPMPGNRVSGDRVPDGPVPDGPVPDGRMPDDRVSGGLVPGGRVPGDGVAGDLTYGRAVNGAAFPAAAGLTAGRLRVLVGVFGTIALCTAYGEGALADWGALHLRTDLHTSAGLAAAAYASFSVAMVIGRLSGSWLLSRAGRTNTLAGGGLIAAGGMLVAALVPTLPLAIAGFVLVGLGLANLFPAAVGQAGALAGPRGVAAASTVGYAGMLMGPPIIGFIADHTGLPVALTTIALLAAVAAAIAVLAHHAEARWLGH